MEELLLEIKNLKIQYDLEGRLIRAVDGVSIEVRRGESFGLVGESGSGKSTIAKAILKLLAQNSKVREGAILFKGKNIIPMTEKEMNGIRWREVSIITQSAMNALNPVARISEQMIETIRAHDKSTHSKKDILDKCKELFGMVGLNKERIMDYPHQFSGGMKQRVIIAMSMALNPDLIIADEPTTALDVMVQAQIINILKKLWNEKKVSLFLITHDIAIISELCERVGVMYAGRLMEYGDIDKVFNNPYHPYTMGLKGAFPSIRRLKQPLISIPGNSPNFMDRSTKCGFSERCPFSIERCVLEAPEIKEIEADHHVACHRMEHAKRFREEIIDLFSTEMRVIQKYD